MKARFSPTTARDTLSKAQQEAIKLYVDDMLRRKQKTIIHRYMLATCLALNDLYSFGDKRLTFVLNGIEDILTAYAGDAFTTSEARNGSLEDGDRDPMAEAMMRELASRKRLHIEMGDFIK